ncbi:MAG TPA: 4-hydroxy-tetrahydrodipicolinate reductase [Steroidobacteraceae bacterium]|nr:4-hydroxy-tetrahydrodipicolinate reductase [Steroidobacteraceae bacterium]
MTTAVLIGATGRMGTAIVRESLRASAAHKPLEVVAAVASPGSKSQGLDIGEIAGVKAIGVRVLDELPADLAKANVAIDFSRPDLSLRALNVCRAAHVPIVIGTTGHGAEFDARVAAASRDIAVLVAPNTSIGVAVAQELVRIAARTLPAEFDIEISEAHHKHKLDAPSGTALALAQSAAAARGLDPHEDTLSGRSGQGARRDGEIGIASIRAGDIVGTHTVLFAGPGERLTVGHEATDRAIFANGAIRAAVWLAAQKPGRYTMANVLGLKTTG